MEQIVSVLIEHGTWGMFVAALLAGSVLPFSSELVMLGLLAAGADGTELLLWATAGNTLGGAINYGIGSLGKTEWIEKVTKVKPEKLEKGLDYVRSYGSWASLLAWVPILGSAITVSLGFLRCRFAWSLLGMGAGKFARYWAIVAAF